MIEQPNGLHPQVRLARLTPYFPPHLIQTVVARPHALPGGVPQLFEGTVLIADLKGFSAQSALLFDPDRHDDDALCTMINQFFDVVLRECHRYGGSPFSFDGDALSILFYGPYHADIALAAAFAIQKSVARAVVRLPMGDVPLQASLGLSSGQLLSASLGREGALICTLLGRTGTRAVGAQKAAAGPQVIVTEATLSSLTLKVTTQEIGPGFYAVDDAGDRLASIALTSFQSSSLPEQDAAWVERLLAFLAAHFPPAVTRQLLYNDVQPDYRYVAALFVNVSGLDELVSRQSLAAVSDLNYFFDGVQHIVSQQGGLLNKVNSYYAGDKYLVLFGLSALPCIEPGLAALRTAFELQTWAAQMPFPLRQRVGLSAGRASECIVGNQWRREFTVIGQPVNEAVHLMELAAWGDIAALGDFCRGVRWEGRKAVPEQGLIKGYDQRVTIYRFLYNRGEAPNELECGD